MGCAEPKCIIGKTVYGTICRAAEPEGDEPFRVGAVCLQFYFSVNGLSDGWQFTEDGAPLNKSYGRAYVNPTRVLPLDLWKFRTTIVKIGPGWEVVSFQKSSRKVRSLRLTFPGFF